VRTRTKYFLFWSLITCALPIWSAESAGTNLNQTNVVVLGLPEVLRLADSQNLDVQIAQRAADEAKANHDAALEHFFPWISPGIQFRRRDGLAQAVPSGLVSDAHFQSYSPGATVAAQVSIGDALFNSRATSKLEQASTNALEAQRHDSTFAAARAYFNLLKSFALLKVAQEALATSENYRGQVKEAVSAGIAFKGDELRVQTQTQRYQVSVLQAEQHQRLASTALAEVLHLDPAIEILPREPGLEMLMLFPTNAPLDQLVQQALRSRPDLKESLQLAEAARQSRNAALYGPWVPTVGAQVYAGAFGGGPDNGPSAFGDAQEYILGAGWRIGPGGLLDFPRIRASKARLESANLKAEKRKDAVVRQVVEAHTLLRSLADQIAAARKNLATADETLRLTRERKQFGIGIVLEDIQAQQELTRAREDFVTAVAEFNTAQYSMLHAVGHDR
jgi:outer membrane protein TolC